MHGADIPCYLQDNASTTTRSKSPENPPQVHLHRYKQGWSTIGMLANSVSDTPVAGLHKDLSGHWAQKGFDATCKNVIDCLKEECGGSQPLDGQSKEGLGRLCIDKIGAWLASVGYPDRQR